MQTEYKGIYRSKYHLHGEPLISIIIPNKDHTEDLEKCISSIENKATYKNVEYIVVENNSEKEETFAYYKELEKKNPKAKVVFWDGTDLIIRRSIISALKKRAENICCS